MNEVVPKETLAAVDSVRAQMITGTFGKSILPDSAKKAAAQ
jgi:hypothetical protein